MIHLLTKKSIAIIATVFLIHYLFVFASLPATVEPSTSVLSNVVEEGENETPVAEKSLYHKLQLSNLGLSADAFEQAMAGYNFLLQNGKLKNAQILTIADFSKPSGKKRLYVIDVKNGKLLFNTYVAHGRNSGRELATSFSNDAESYKSSLGFFVTGDTYNGKHGFSLKLLGEEKGINDNACNRAIVMHSAAYVSEDAIRLQGFVGRSLGCPALPVELNKPIIETIKNGSCLFLYSPDKYYAMNSTVLRKVS